MDETIKKPNRRNHLKERLSLIIKNKFFVLLYVFLFSQTIFLFVIMANLNSSTDSPFQETSENQEVDSSTDGTEEEEVPTDVTNENETDPLEYLPCIDNLEEFEALYLRAKEDILKAVELTEKIKLQVTYTGISEGGYDDTVYIYDPVNNNYSGNSTFVVNDNDESQEQVYEFKDGILIVTDKKTGEIIEQKAAEFEIDPLFWIKVNLEEDILLYSSPLIRNITKEETQDTTIYSFIFGNAHGSGCDDSDDYPPNGHIKYEISKTNGFLTKLERAIWDYGLYEIVPL